MMMMPPFCAPCAHLHYPVNSPDLVLEHVPIGTCDAFPEGVPDVIAYGGHDHRLPFDGDGGVTFEHDAERTGWTDAQAANHLDIWLRIGRRK